MSCFINLQVRGKSSGAVYAMKVMRKERILEKDHGEYVRSERDVLTAVLHPYIVTLRFSFQTSTKLYLVLDFISGGHLFFNLYKQVRRSPLFESLEAGEEGRPCVSGGGYAFTPETSWLRHWLFGCAPDGAGGYPASVVA